jgi:hypothetical protein
MHLTIILELWGCCNTELVGMNLTRSAQADSIVFLLVKALLTIHSNCSFDNVEKQSETMTRSVASAGFC